MNKNIAVPVVAAVVGAGVAVLYYTVGPGAQPLACAGGPHCRDVSVIVVNGAPKIQEIPDDTFTRSGGVMKWELTAATVAAGYVFAPNGINFYPTPAKPAPHQAPAGVFNDCKPMPQGTANPTKFQCNNTHSANGTWAYLVTLKKGVATVTLDPYIVNN